MKKFSCLMLSLLLVFLLAAPAWAEDSLQFLPTVDSLLAMGLNGQITEVCDDLDAYTPLNEPYTDLEQELTFVVLQREAPLKEFTAKTVYPPFSDDDGFDVNFNGVDEGKSRIWLRGDIMSRLPEYFLADSIENANYLLIAETFYILSGGLVVTTFKDNGQQELPEFETAEEMALYFLEHPKEVDYKTYYPLFDAFSILSLYETKTGRVTFFDLKQSQAPYFGRNMEAGQYWEKMQYVSELIDALDAEKGIDTAYAAALIGVMDFVPPSKTAVWQACIDEGEYSTAQYSVSDYFWSMAGELKALDPSEENRNNYDLIISAKNRLALQLFVSYCDYNGFERSVDSIGESGDYMAPADTEWFEEAFASLFEGVFE